MPASRTLSVNITGDPSSLQRAFRTVERDSTRMGNSLHAAGRAGVAMGKTLAVGVAGATAAFGAFVASSLKDLVAQEKISAQTAAVIKSTGGAAGVSQKQIEGLADSIEKMSGIQAESVQEGENLLATFTGIHNAAGRGNDIFTQATRIMTDMSVAMGTDAKSQAIQLGKALNDPIKGVSALSRVGVTFTKQQKDQIKAMVAAGDTMGAQKVILGELNKEFGGSAKALGETMEGRLNILKARLGDVGETIASKLLPILERVVAWVEDHWPQISAAFDAVYQGVRAAVGGIVVAVQAIITAAGPVVAWFRENLVPAIQGAVAVIVAVWQRIAPIVKAAMEAVWRVVGPLIAFIKNNIEAVMAIISGDWGKAWEKIRQIPIKALKLALAAIEGIGRVLWEAAKALGKLLIDGLGAGVRALGGLLVGWLRSAFEKITGLYAFVLGKAKDLGMGILRGVGNALAGLGGVIRDGIMAALGAIGDLAGDALTAAKDLGLKIAEGIGNGLKAAAEAIKDFIWGLIPAPLRHWIVGGPSTAEAVETLQPALTTPGSFDPTTGRRTASKRSLPKATTGQRSDSLGEGIRAVLGPFRALPQREDPVDRIFREIEASGPPYRAPGPSGLMRGVRDTLAPFRVRPPTPPLPFAQTLAQRRAWQRAERARQARLARTSTVAAPGYVPTSPSYTPTYSPSYTPSYTPTGTPALGTLSAGARVARVAPPPPWVAPGSRATPGAGALVERALGAILSGLNLPSVAKALASGVPASIADSLSATEGTSDFATRTASLHGRAAARAQGLTGQDVTDAGEAAADKARLGILNNLIKQAAGERKKLTKVLAEKRAAWAKIKVPKKDGPAKDDALKARALLKRQIRKILNELSTLAHNIKGWQLEKAELGETSDDIDRTDEATEEPVQAGPSDNELATLRAGLTPGLDDDLAAAATAVNIAGGALGLAESAFAAADTPATRQALADALRLFGGAVSTRDQIQAQIDALKATQENTAAVAANTDAVREMTGTVILNYRGQTYRAQTSDSLLVPNL